MEEAEDVGFKTYVNKNHHKFPLVVQVKEGLYGSNELDAEVQDFSCNDYLQLLRLVPEVNVTFESFYDLPSHQGQITLPLDYDRTLEVQSRFPDGHVFPTAADVLNDCVMYIYPQVQFEVQGETVQSGDRLKVIRKAVMPRGGEYLLCKLIRADKNLMIPLDTKADFVKKGGLTTCRLSDILDRLPQRVRVVRDESMRIRELGHAIEGLPEDYSGELLLSKVDFVEACLWDNPEKIIKIPCTVNINVASAAGFDSQFGHVCDIHKLVERNVAQGRFSKIVIADDEKTVDKLGLALDKVFKINGQHQAQAVLVKGDDVPLLLPHNLKGVFKCIPQEFRTAMDLLESNFKGKVRVTREYNATDPRGDSLYANDLVELHCKEMLVVPKVVGTQYEEHELVLLDRHFSNQGHVGLVKVPTYACANFKSSVLLEEEFLLNKILEFPLPVTVSYVDSAASSPQTKTDEYHLEEGQKVTVHGVYSFAEIYITPDDEDSNSESTSPINMVKVVPDYVPLQVRPLRPKLPGSTLPTQSESQVIPDGPRKVVRLDEEQFENILKDIEIRMKIPTYVEADPTRRPSRQLPEPPENDYDRPVVSPWPTVEEVPESTHFRGAQDSARYQPSILSTQLPSTPHTLESNLSSSSSASSPNIFERGLSTPNLVRSKSLSPTLNSPDDGVTSEEHPSRLTRVRKSLTSFSFPKIKLRRRRKRTKSEPSSK